MMNKMLLTITLLVISNIFMTLAWYGHLKFKQMDWFHNLGLVSIILISWGIAFLNIVFRLRPTELGLRKTEVLLTFGS